MKNIPRTFLTHASNILGDTDKGLTGGEITQLFSAYSIDYNVENLPHGETLWEAPNKRTAILENISVFSPEQQYEIIRELCSHSKLTNNSDAQNLKIQLIARYGKEFGQNSSLTLNQNLVEEVKSFLVDYPKSEQVYLSALTKFNNDIFERNLVDDLRLSLELLLKDIFQNNKSLENQISEIGVFISNNGGSKHFSNMFRTLVDYYTKYQNAFVKHDDAILEDEVEFIFEMTSSFMKQLIKMDMK